MADTLVHQRVAAARTGSEPHVITKMRSGWVVIGDRQPVEGYCLLLPDPVVPDLNSLDEEARSQFLLDMATIGDVLLTVTGAKRINYEILGNSEPVLHAHLFPRYESEPTELRKRPVWFYDWSKAPLFDPERQRDFVEAVAGALRTASR